MLKNKNILLISVQFFEYEKLIKEQLEHLGAQVDYYDERPSNSFFSKAIIRIKKNMYTRQINKYFAKIIEEIRTKSYDYFLLIKGEATPKFFLEFLRSNNPKIRLIFYTYDSFKNNSSAWDILEYFDSKFSFDRLDTFKYNMRFRPLFFVKKYNKIYNLKKDLKYDLAFIGTAHSDRYTISEWVKNWCNERGLKMFNYYFSPSKLLFRYKKMTDPNFKHIQRSCISFRSLSHDDVIEIYKRSKIILDINHPDQSGLTMRTFETLGSGRKLITTNPNIKHYPFFSQENIYILNRDNPVLLDDFFKSDFKVIPSDILHMMSLEGWIEDVFDLNEADNWKDVDI